MQIEPIGLKYYTIGQECFCKFVADELQKRGKIKNFMIRPCKNGLYRLYVDNLKKCCAVSMV